MSILNDCIFTENEKSKAVVAICIPAKDQVHTKFAYCLTQLMLHSQAQGIECKLYFSLGTLIVNQREKLVKDALGCGASHILWIDADMTFPADSLDQLLTHDVDVVASNYATRRSPVKSVAFKDAGDWESYLIHDETQNTSGLTEVDAVGMGLMLEKTSIYKQLSRPWFQLMWDEVVEDHHGEDMFHCRQVKHELGGKILIDCALSRYVRHLGDHPFSLDMVTKPPMYY